MVAMRTPSGNIPDFRGLFDRMSEEQFAQFERLLPAQGAVFFKEDSKDDILVDRNASHFGPNRPLLREKLRSRLERRVSTLKRVQTPSTSTKSSRAAAAAAADVFANGLIATATAAATTAQQDKDAMATSRTTSGASAASTAFRSGSAGSSASSGRSGSNGFSTSAAEAGALAAAAAAAAAAQAVVVGGGGGGGVGRGRNSNNMIINNNNKGNNGNNNNNNHNHQAAAAAAAAAAATALLANNDGWNQLLAEGSEQFRQILQPTSSARMGRTATAAAAGGSFFAATGSDMLRRSARFGSSTQIGAPDVPPAPSHRISATKSRDLVPGSNSNNSEESVRLSSRRSIEMLRQMLSTAESELTGASKPMTGSLTHADEEIMNQYGHLATADPSVLRLLDKMQK